MDSYLENAMDYVQEAFESANQWMKENDPLRFPEVKATICISIGDGPHSDPRCAGGNGGAAPSSSSMGGGGGSSSSFSSFGNNGIGQGNSFGSGDKFGASTSGASEPKWEPYPSIDLSKPQALTEVKIDMFDKMGNMKGMPTMPIPTPEQETNSGDNTQAGGSSEESKQESEAAENAKQEEAKVEKAEDELKELKEKHLKTLEDTSKSSDTNAEARGKAVQDVAEKVIIRGTESIGAGVGFVAGGALGGPLGAAFGAVGGKVAGEKVAEYSIKKAKEVVDEHEKEKEEL